MVAVEKIKMEIIMNRVCTKLAITLSLMGFMLAEEVHVDIPRGQS
jgi:hypothetical protein